MKLRTSRQYMIILFCSMMISGCLTTHPPVNTLRYSLPEAETPAAMPAATHPAPPTLILAHIQLADYLDTDRMVIQLDDVSLQATRDHLWREALPEELRRGLRNRLASRLPHILISDPVSGQSLSTPRLHLTIDQFHGQLKGYAVLSGQWYVQLPNQPQSQPHPFHLSTPLAESGYPALVRALGHDLDLLSAEIATQLHHDVTQ